MFLDASVRRDSFSICKEIRLSPKSFMKPPVLIATFPVKCVYRNLSLAVVDSSTYSASLFDIPTIVLVLDLEGISPEAKIYM